MKLYYFDMAGRAESIRMLLDHAKVEYIDYRFGPPYKQIKSNCPEFEQWSQFKTSGKLEYEQIPMLEIDGKSYTQSSAILMMLGQKYGYLPTDPDQAYRCFNINFAVEDMLIKAVQYTMFAPATPEKKEELKKEYFEKTLPIFLGAFEKKLKENSTQDYMVGNSITVADFDLISFFRHIVHLSVVFEGKIFMECLQKYPVLETYWKKNDGELAPFQTKLQYE